jgi:glutaredoxin
MIIELYLYEKFDKNAEKILELLDKTELEFSVMSFSSKNSLKDISYHVGEKVKRLPTVLVDGKQIGGYYDLVELLVNNGFIDYKGDLCPKQKRK